MEQTEEEEWIEMPEGWGPTKKKNDDSGDEDSSDDEKMMMDLFANADPRESFQFQVRIPQEQDETKKNTDDVENGEATAIIATAKTETRSKTIRISGFKLDSGESARSTGVTLWEAAPRLSNYIMNNSSELIQRKKVLELGAGLGLPGIVAYHLGAKQVVLTDLDTHAMQKMRENVKFNCHKDDNDSTRDSHICCLQLKWGRPLPDHPFKIQHGTFDTILAADVIYVEESIDPLFDTVSMLLKPNGGKFILSWMTRWNNVPEDLVVGAANSRNLQSHSEPEKGIYVFEWKKEDD